GAMDVFIVNNGSTPMLYRNRQTNHWLKVKLFGTISNRDAIGSMVTLIPDLSQPTNKAQLGLMDGGDSFLGQSERIVHFGLVTRTNVDRVLIKWPSGLSQKFDHVLANTILYALEEGDYEQWKKARFTPAQLQNPNASGNDADLDLDGRLTVSEYAFGSDPTIADPSSGFSTRLQMIGGTNFL